ncbi:ABC transporter permease [Nocardia sp. CA-128927]|uniref:ABC transporter permease n=1 Tax=Nocardia sp. CA-128927 TaxID=3239975 RepID=UPI003D996A25
MAGGRLVTGQPHLPTTPHRLMQAAMTITAPSVRISGTRVYAVVERAIVLSFFHSRAASLFGIILLSAVAEPVLYLLALGLGVGSLVDRKIIVDGHALSYVQFVSPGMLAVSCMTGAISASVFSFYARHRHLGIFRMICSTSVNSYELVLADLIWNIFRVTMLSGIFVIVMAVTGLVDVGNAFAAFLATILVNAAFCAVGMGVSTLLRGWQDFDIITVVQTMLFLFSGTFFPIDQYPSWIQAIVQISPLYHSIELIRALTIGNYGLALIGHISYLLLMVVGGLIFSGWRLDKDLSR